MRLESVTKIILSNGMPYVLDAELYVARNLTMIGEAAEGGELATLDAQANEKAPRRILNIAAGAFIELYNLTLTGAWMPDGSDPGGGAISNAGRLRMHGCTLMRNRALIGAAIFSSGELFLHDCELTDNFNAYAGALAVYSGSATVSECRFERNHASIVGAALLVLAPTLVMDSFVRVNTAGDAGGGVWNAGELIIERSEIVNNLADNVGGGIMNTGVLGTRLVLRDSSVANNTAYKQGGGMLNNFAAIVSTFNVLFTGNRALQGAAIYNAGNLTLTNASLRQNNASAIDFFAGAGLYNLGNATLEKGTQIQGNLAQPGKGASIYNGHEAVYVMPAPLGYHLESVFECKIEYCQPLGSSLQEPCPKQSCDYNRFGGKHMMKLTQGTYDKEFPHACAPGYFGNNASAHDQSSFACSGSCPRGYTCPKATVMPQLCPANHYCTEGLASPCPTNTFAVNSTLPSSLADCKPCPANAEGSNTTGECRCSHDYYAHRLFGKRMCISWSDGPTIAPLYFVGWGLPGWASLISIVVVAVLRSWRMSRRGLLVNTVYTALRAVDIAENERRSAYSHSSANVLRLRRMARLIIGCCVLVLPWWPALRSTTSSFTF